MNLDNIYIIKDLEETIIYDAFIKEELKFNSLEDFLNNNQLYDKKIYISDNNKLPLNIKNLNYQFYSFKNTEESILKDCLGSLFINNVKSISIFDIVKSSKIKMKKFSIEEIDNIVKNNEFIEIKQNFLNNNHKYNSSTYLFLKNKFNLEIKKIEDSYKKKIMIL